MAVVGVVSAWLELDRSVLAAYAVYTAVLGMVVPTVARRRAAEVQQVQPGPEVSHREVLRPAVRSAALVTVGNVALLGLMAAFGVGAVVLPVLLAAGSPRVLAWCRNARQQRHPAGGASHSTPQAAALSSPQAAASSTPQAVAGAGGRVPAEMSLDELCRAWRASYPELRRCGDVRRQVEVVQARRQYLDELERRDPVAFALWLRSGARAASDPGKYLTGGRRA